MYENLNQATMSKADMFNGTPRYVGPQTLAKVLNLKFTTVLKLCSTDGL